MSSRVGAMVIIPIEHNNIKNMEEEMYFLGMRVIKRYDKSEVITILDKKIVIYVVYCDNSSTCEYLKRIYEVKY